MCCAFAHLPSYYLSFFFLFLFCFHFFIFGWTNVKLCFISKDVLCIVFSVFFHIVSHASISVINITSSSLLAIKVSNMLMLSMHIERRRIGVLKPWHQFIIIKEQRLDSLIARRFAISSVLRNRVIIRIFDTIVSN
jgi:hypothetical protein